MNKAKRLPIKHFEGLKKAFLEQHDYKYYLLINTAAYTGLRIAEILKITWKDLLNEEQQYEVQEDKTDKFRIVDINDNLRAIALEMHAAYTDKLGHKPAMDDIVFYSRNDKSKPLTRQSVDTRIKRISRDLYGADYSCHSFRKLFAFSILDNTKNKHVGLVLLKNIFRHSNVNTTQVYLGLDDIEARDAVMNIRL